MPVVPVSHLVKQLAVLLLAFLIVVGLMPLCQRCLTHPSVFAVAFALVVNFFAVQALRQRYQLVDQAVLAVMHAVVLVLHQIFLTVVV